MICAHVAVRFLTVFCMCSRSFWLIFVFLRPLCDLRFTYFFQVLLWRVFCVSQVFFVTDVLCLLLRASLWMMYNNWKQTFCSKELQSSSTCSNQIWKSDLLCGLVVRVPDHRSTGPGFDSRRYQIFCEIVGLELSLLSTIEELLGRNSSDSGPEKENTAVGIRCADYATPSIRKSWH
jgi:hypothetical protein